MYNVQGMYRCIGDVKMYGGSVQVYGGIQTYKGCKDVWGAYRCMGDVQMYGVIQTYGMYKHTEGHTDALG